MINMKVRFKLVRYFKRTNQLFITEVKIFVYFFPHCMLILYSCGDVC